MSLVESPWPDSDKPVNWRVVDDTMCVVCIILNVVCFTRLIVCPLTCTLLIWLIIKIIYRKEYFEIAWGAMRATVEPAFAERTLINHVEYLPKAHIITSAASGITANEVITAQGGSVGFDYLVIATGHPGGPEFTRAEKLRQYRAGKEVE